MENKASEIILLEPFQVIGIAIRTTNENLQSKQDIEMLWGRFFAENVLSQIPNKVSDTIYCIYTDYEKDHSAPYTTIIGCKVNAIENVPEGMVLKEIPATKYQVFTCVGKMPDAVVDTWLYIWKSDIDRKYIADFEVYDEKSQDPVNAVVRTYLSVI